MSLVLNGKPPAPQIDRTHAGILHISPTFLGVLLRLPAGQEVTAARVNSTGDLELMVEGKGLLPRSLSGKAFPVSLICHQQTRPGGVNTGGYEQKITMRWQHDPDVRWVLNNWEPAT